MTNQQSMAVMNAEEYVDATPVHHAEVSIVRDLTGVEHLRSAWTSAQWHPNSDIDFYMGVVRSWQERCTPYVLALCRNNEPEALLVGRAEDARIECRVGYKALCHIKARQLTFIYGGQLGRLSPENSAVLFDAVMASLRRGEADVAEFHFLRTDSPLYERIANSQFGLGRDFASCVQIHRSTALPPSGEQFYGKLSMKVRKNQRWQANKIVRDFDGKVRIRCFRKPEDMPEMFCHVEKVASKTYQRQMGVGFDGTQEQRERLCAEAYRGRLRAHVLYLREEPAAFWVGTVYQNTLHSDFMGYDTEYAKYSPGMYLVVKAVAELCDSYPGEAVRHIDWGLGDAQYKEVLGDCSWMEAQIRVFAPTPRGIGINLVRTPIALVDLLLKRILSRSGALQLVKTKWRRRLRQKTQPLTALVDLDSGGKPSN